MCTSERCMNDLSQMQEFEIFPWREGGREEVAERFKPQVGSRLGNSNISPPIIDARCLLSKFTICHNNSNNLTSET